ncbi:conserved hypothetical protein [Staphylothermus marinus F1]|uniref:Uncharacterized protein n=1 Tax=Staphylothermus marinus (strain ATCC 43588 / DSM 3639 / JCM 9404 / F1) TaxID=399550 RepID=A3DKQ6_STAMF|nr:hypothetical protein [Staphylothermus marinus]ABN69216.1 conserved hypothetical protein [Staphylothermus marinus F1]
MSSQEKKTYTIRGLDPELYKTFSETAKKLGLSVGEFMNEAMRALLTTISFTGEVGQKIGKEASKLLSEFIKSSRKSLKEAVESVKNTIVISGIEELDISRNDLEDIDKQVVLVNIKKLYISDDVDWKLLDEKIKSIKMVNEISIPNHIPKLLFAKKCFMVKRIIVRSEKREEVSSQNVSNSISDEQ